MAPDPLQALHSYYEAVRQRARRRYSTPNGSAARGAPSRPGDSETPRLFPHSPSNVPYGSRRTGSRRLYAGHRLANTWAPARLIPDSKTKPGSGASSRLSTRQQQSSPCPPPDASRALFPHRSPRRSSANAACGGLRPSPIGRSRRADYPPSPVEHCLNPVITYPSPSLSIRCARFDVT